MFNFAKRKDNTQIKSLTWRSSNWSDTSLNRIFNLNFILFLIVFCIFSLSHCLWKCNQSICQNKKKNTLKLHVPSFDAIDRFLRHIRFYFINPNDVTSGICLKSGDNCSNGSCVAATKYSSDQKKIDMIRKLKKNI